jgi:hypothetical protein
MYLLDSTAFWTTAEFASSFSVAVLDVEQETVTSAVMADIKDKSFFIAVNL